jgi:putative membrane protein
LIPIADQAPQMLDDVTAQITQGFGTLKSVATSLVTGLDTAKSGLPAMTTPQQVQLMSVLSDPVAVNQTSGAASGSDSRTIALVFGAATALLAGALLMQTAAPLVQERRRVKQEVRD